MAATHGVTFGAPTSKPLPRAETLISPEKGHNRSGQRAEAGGLDWLVARTLLCAGH